MSGVYVFFGIVIPYTAAVVFVLGILHRIWKWAGAPVPFHIPTTCGQQKSLPLWNDLSPEQQGLAREHYERFQRLPEHDRQSVERLYRRWQGLPPTKQQRLRENYERYRKLDPAQRKLFDSEYLRWKSHRRVERNAGTE